MPPAGVLPEAQIVLPERELGLGERPRIGHQAGRQLEDGRSEIERVRAGSAAIDRAAPLGQTLQELLAAIGDLAEDLGDLLAVALRRFLLLGHRAFLYAFAVLGAAYNTKDRWIMIC